jgi:uracil-DNA glycosylase
MSILLNIQVPYDEKLSLFDNLMTNPPISWDVFFREVVKSEVKKACDILEKNGQLYYPLPRNVFRAFHLTPLTNLKVMIIGQDPYHTTNYDNTPQADGLSFSSSINSPIPSSLKNIYAELKRSYTDFVIPSHPDLSYWAQQGVLMYNTCLTVTPGKAGSHGRIWAGLTAGLLNYLNENAPNLIYVLWGAKAQEYKGYITNEKNVLESGHPSSLARNAKEPFYGNGHFVKINEKLVAMGKRPIDWQIR